jgi:sulfhydrogenase subunit beta (sulfur reductase)
VADRAQAVLARAEIGKLIAALANRGFEVIGPVVRDGAIALDHVEHLEDLPVGWTAVQGAGRYRLERRSDEALFGYAVGPHSWKAFLFPPTVRLWSAERSNGGFRIVDEAKPATPRYAFLGVRACDLAAIAVQDRVLIGGHYVDPVYASRRDGVFVVAVHCGHSAETCFCASMQTGPAARGGFDLALTELGHEFLVDVGSDAGAAVLADLSPQPVTDAVRERARVALEASAAQQTRRMNTDGLKELLNGAFEHPHWKRVSERCLACANCTMVCPTCFCSAVQDVSDVTGDHAERWRVWDSCFTLDHTYIHGGSVRASGEARYRQWLTHKFAGWVDQFGTSGCVGCGRCIAWCPAGIDIVQEVEGLREG